MTHELFRDLLTGLVILLVSIVGWFATDHNKRIRELEATRITEKDAEERREQLRDEVEKRREELRQDNREAIGRIETRVREMREDMNTQFDRLNRK